MSKKEINHKTYRWLNAFRVSSKKYDVVYNLNQKQILLKNKLQKKFRFILLVGSEKKITKI